MKRLTALVLLASTPALAQEQSSDFGAWFLRNFGPAPAGDVALEADAHDVFASVLAVADRKAGREPRLLVVDKRDGMEAQALPDGTIVVNPALLRFCRGSPPQAPGLGHARLAFVLGHEMAHLAYDDAWHAQAFSALNRYGDPSLARATSDWMTESAAEHRAKELRADRAGFLFMLMAGYPPQGVMGPSSDFLTDWAKVGSAPAAGEDPQHPPLRERAQVLQVQLRAVQQDLPFYRYGVRLLTLGRYEDSIRMLQRFYGQLPSREAGANLGAAYHGRAMARLRSCGAREGWRFRFQPVVDPETLATRLRLRGDADTRCRAAARSDLIAARQVLEEAFARDASHLPARLDLALVLLALGEGLEAYRVATGGARTAGAGPAALPTDPRLANVAAVALYAAGRELPMDTADAALDALDQLAKRVAPASEPELAASLRFNRARINQEQGRAAAARAGWEALLAAEPEGPWAEETRLALVSLGMDAARPGVAPAPSTSPHATLATRIGGALRKRLEQAQRSSFTLGDLKGAFLQGDGVAGLELAGVLELVEETLEPPLPLSALGDARPRTEVETLGGRRTRVYSDVAYDVVAGRAVTRLLFER